MGLGFLTERRKVGLPHLLLFVAAFSGTFYAAWRYVQPSGNPPGAASEKPGPLVLNLVPSYGPLPDFALIDADGNRLAKKDLLGKVWVASFIFTNCAGTCPVMASRNQMLQAMLPEGVVMLSISVDPDRDTPAVLTEWGKKFDRDPAKWLLATGDFIQINQLMRKGFEMPGDNPLLHSSGFVLVDGFGNRRGYYEALERDEMPRLLRDVNLVLHEGEPPETERAPAIAATAHKDSPIPPPAPPPPPPGAKVRLAPRPPVSP